MTRRTAELSSAPVMAAVCILLASLGCAFDLPPLVGDAGGGGGGTAGSGAIGGGGGTAGSGAIGGGTCDERWYDCNADGADGCETDTWTDSNHCGSCARDCYDGACDQGKCQPVVLIAQNLGCVIAVDTDWVYTYNESSRAIQKTPKAGGSPISIGTTDGTFVHELVADATHLYLTQNAEDQVFRVDKNGGGIQTAVVSGDDSRRLAVDQSHVYWFNDIQVPRQIRRAPKGAGTTPETIITDSGMDSAHVLAVDEAWLYWSSHNDMLRRVPKEGGVAETVADGATAEYGLELDATHLYFLDYDRDRVASVPKDGSGPVAALASMAGESGSGIGIDDTTVFWLSRSALRKVPKDGSVGATTIADGLEYACGLAVDRAGGHVYYIDDSGGRLARVAK